MSYRKFLRNLLILLVAWFAIDRVGADLMSAAHERTTYSKARKIREITSCVDADVVLLGTSRCQYHYVPSILSDSLHMTVYNAGIDASNNIYSQYAALSCILRYHTPKMVCLDTGESEFGAGDAHDYDPLNVFAPYYGLCSTLDSLFRRAGQAPLYSLSHLYRYHTKAELTLGGLVLRADTLEEHGFYPLFTPATPPEPVAAPVLAVDSLKLDCFRRFIALCREHDIMLILAISPSLTQFPPDFYAPIREMAAAYDIPLFDYDTSGLFTDQPELFCDATHLTGDGARRFTSHFAHDLIH